MMDVAVLLCTWSGSTRYPGVGWHYKHLGLDIATSEVVCHIDLRCAQEIIQNRSAGPWKVSDPPMHTVMEIFRISRLGLPARPAHLMRPDHPRSPCRYHFVSRLARRHRCPFACYF